MGKSVISPEGIISDAVELINKSRDTSFPCEIFPQEMREIIFEMNDTLCLPIDFTASSILVAIATVIGNTHVLKFKNTWKARPILYMVLLGNPGVNKSHPLETIFQPLVDYDREQERKFLKEYRAYFDFMNMSKKDKKELGKDFSPLEPVRTRFLVSDITQEAMAKALVDNKRGVCLLMDELAAWMNNFTRYNKGSEEQFYISLFNGSYYSSDRKDCMNYTLVEHPFTCVIGTMQPEIAISLLKGSRNQNGFAERLLFAIPDNQTKQYWAKKDLREECIDTWKDMLGKLIYFPIEKDQNGEIIPVTMEYDEDAKERLYEWQHYWADMINAEPSDKIKGICNKFETYIHRFCLIIQVCKWVCGEGSNQVVDRDSVEKAIKLVGYYVENALLVNEIVNQPTKDADEKLYLALPGTFTRAEGLAIAQALKWKERTFDRYLKKMRGTKLIRDQFGKYKKRVAK